MCSLVTFESCKQVVRAGVRLQDTVCGWNQWHTIPSLAVTKRLDHLCVASTVYNTFREITSKKATKVARTVRTGNLKAFCCWLRIA